MSSSRYKCCVSKCGKNVKDGITLFCFPDAKSSPKNQTRLKVWLDVIKNPKITVQNSTRYRVCSDHFASNNITLNNRLVRNTIPTVNLEVENDSEPYVVSIIKVQNKVLKFMDKYMVDVEILELCSNNTTS